MPELREDPVSGRWVCLAPGRASRPEAIPPRPIDPGAASRCPFCEGHESETPPEVLALRERGAADSPGWRVRVVPNLYPAFTADSGVDPAGAGVFVAQPALGACEVVIHGPAHDVSFPDLEPRLAGEIMLVTQQRYRALSGPSTRSVVALLNHGREAGASLPHPHGQVFATAISAPVVEEEVEHCRAALARDGRCLICRIVEQERADGTRVVALDEHFIAVTPWASRGPYELWILPRAHEADFGRAPIDVASGLGHFLRSTLRTLTGLLGDVPLNWYLHSVPLPGPDVEAAYHWHLEVRPVISRLAGFELATGTLVNTVPPELAAEQLRSVSHTS